MKARGKRVAFLTAVGALLVLGVAGVLLRKEVVEQWYIWRLGSSQEKVRLEAIDRLGDLRSARSVPGLLKLAPRMLPDIYSPEAKSFDQAVVKIGRPAVPALLQHARVGSLWDRSHVLDLLWAIGPNADDLPFLIQSLETDLHDPWMDLCKLRAAELLGRLGPAAHPAIPLLIRNLTERPWSLRHECAQALGSIGPRAAEAEPHLEQMAVCDENLQNREAAVQALELIRAAPRKP
jgi:HEAT repeat protein